jgi:hypothetical protein
MTTQTRNEAAERLRVHLRNREQSWFGREDQWTEIERQLTEALAAERRATAERIRARIALIPDSYMRILEPGEAIPLAPMQEVHAILDDDGLPSDPDDEGVAYHGEAGYNIRERASSVPRRSDTGTLAILDEEAAR